MEVSGVCKRIGFRVKSDALNGIFSENFGISRLWALARDCYTVAIMEGTVHFASSAVECAINLDSRMQIARKRHVTNHSEQKHSDSTRWLTLGSKNLREARINGLPVEKLIDKGESIEEGAPLIRFAYRRNKVAHGDYSGFLSTLANSSPRIYP
jgi:hypothetical protein